MEGRKREEGVGELQNVASHKRGLTNWRGGRGKSGLVSFEKWHMTNEDSLPGGEKVGEVGWCGQKRGTFEARNHLREGRGRAALDRADTWPSGDEDASTGAEDARCIE